VLGSNETALPRRVVKGPRVYHGCWEFLWAKKQAGFILLMLHQAIFFGDPDRNQANRQTRIELNEHGKLPIVRKELTTLYLPLMGRCHNDNAYR
jgi:hypothetical protein